MDRDPNQTVRKTAEEALRRLAGELEAGRSEALTRYLTGMSRFRAYSWQNVLLITAQRPDAAQVAGIHAWNDLGRVVKRGEKGILIFVPGAAKQEPHGRTALPKDDPFRMAGFRAASVFDVSQTEGRPLLELTRALDPGEYAEQLKALVAKRAIDLKYDRSLTQAVTYVVSRGLGLETHGAPADYSALYAGDKRAFAQSLAVIQETSAQILDELLREGRTFAGIVATPPAQKRFPLDAEGFAQVHSQYRDRVVQSIAGMVRDREKAQDIAGRAFETAWEKRDGFRGEALPSTWIAAIARREAWLSQNRERRIKFDSMDRADARELAAPGRITDELERRDDQFRLQQALARLPAMYRRILVAHFVDGFSVRDIARRQRVPLGTVLSRIHQGKQLLRQAWETPLGESHAQETEHMTGSPQLRDEQRSQRPQRGPDPRTKAEPPEPVTWDR